MSVTATPTRLALTTPWSIEASQGDDEACDWNLEQQLDDILAVIKAEAPEYVKHVRFDSSAVLRQSLSAVSDWVVAFETNSLDDATPHLSAEGWCDVVSSLCQTRDCLQETCTCGYDWVDLHLDSTQTALEELSDSLADAIWWVPETCRPIDAFDVHELLHHAHRGRGFSWFECHIDEFGDVTLRCEGGTVRACCVVGDSRQELLELIAEHQEHEDIVDVIVAASDQAIAVANELVLASIEADDGVLLHTLVAAVSSIAD